MRTDSARARNHLQIKYGDRLHFLCNMQTALCEQHADKASSPPSFSPSPAAATLSACQRIQLKWGSAEAAKTNYIKSSGKVLSKPGGAFGRTREMGRSRLSRLAGHNPSEEHNNTKPIGFLVFRGYHWSVLSSISQDTIDLFPSLLSTAEEHLSLLPPTPRPNLTFPFWLSCFSAQYATFLSQYLGAFSYLT